MKKILEKLLSFLRVRVTPAGLEVSDRVIRLVMWNGKVWQMHAMRLEPGVMELGKIRDRGALVAALAALKAKVGNGLNSKKTNVVVCMSSLQMYTEVFSLPVVRGENFEEAVQLNLQMASPLDANDSHASWEVVGRDAGTLRTEVLSAFAEKKAVDEMVDAIFEAGFLAMAIEPRALALTRVLHTKGAGVDAAKSYLLIDIDNSGIDFLIIRKGALYFEYATQWKDLMDEKGESALLKCETALTASRRQVLNFYTLHCSEPMAAVILSAVALESEAEKVLAENSPLPVGTLTLVMGQPISSEWLAALGCSLRGEELTARDHGIDLLGEDSKDRFREEQLVSFMRFWSAVVPIALGILVLTFVVSRIFLSGMRADIESRSNLTLPVGEAGNVAELLAKAASFNQEVALVGAAESMQNPKSPFFEAVTGIAAANHITIDHLSFQSFGTPVTLSGSAVAENDVVSFKAALIADSRFTNVSLPLTAVQTQGNTVTFAMTFNFTP